jgi:membrane protein
MKALALVVVFGVSSALSFNLFVFGGRTARLIETALGIESGWSTSLELVRWPVVVGSMTITAMLLYTIVPFRRIPFRVAWPGAVTFGVLWTFATGSFSGYVAGFAHYSSVYGAIAGIIILMSWFYISSLMLLFGAEVNAVWLKLREAR